MNILMINKFLYPNGGSETYIFKLGDFLKAKAMKFSTLVWNMRDVVWAMLSMPTHPT